MADPTPWHIERATRAMYLSGEWGDTAAACAVSDMVFSQWMSAGATESGTPAQRELYEKVMRARADHKLKQLEALDAACEENPKLLLARMGLVGRTKKGDLAVEPQRKKADAMVEGMLRQIKKGDD